MRSEAAALLAELDPLARPERMRLLAQRARTLNGSGDLGQVLDDLCRGDLFHREIAIFMAVVAGHQPTIEAAVTDPAWDVHRPAVSAWLRSGGPSASQVAAFVTRQASWRTRRHVYRLMLRLRMTAVADELAGVVWDRFGDGEAARLLPACSAPVAARLLPEFGHAAGNWSLLGRRHPAVVLDAAGAQLAELAGRDRAGWWGRHGAGVLAAGAVFPDRVLDLLERFLPSGSLPGRLEDYAVLAAADPRRVIGLLAAPGRSAWLGSARLPGSLLRRLAGLEPAVLSSLAQQLRRREPALAALLDAVPPSRRAALYQEAYAGVERSQARPSDQMLEVLPRALRHAEVQRVLELGLVRADAALTLHYTAFLPWQEAKAALTAATRQPQAEDRASGYELLVQCADRAAAPDAVAEAVTYLQRLRNEQDPVRARALTALAAVTPGLLPPQSAPALAQITADALSSRDASNQSRQALTRLAIAVLRDHPGSPPLAGWSLRTLQDIFGDYVPSLGRIDTRLRYGQEQEFFRAVQDWLEAGMRRGSYEPLFAVARALGRRARQLPGLQDMLSRAIDPANVSAVMRKAVTLWLDDPAYRSQRVEQVLAVDSSAVALPAVWTVLCRRRTDLVDQFLAGQPPHGKFLAAGIRWVPQYSPGAERWLPRQQAAYARLLADVAADAGAKIHERTAAITVPASAGDAGWDLVHRYLSSASTSLAEAALAALARTGRPRDVLPILLSHAGDDQARVAIYAASRAARYLPPADLQTILTGELASGGKITARKEMLRLAATLQVPDAGDILQQAWNQPGQHRDIRAAIVAAARQRLHDPASWLILGQAATGSPEEARAVVPWAGPLGLAPRHRRRYAELITRICGSTDQDTAKTAWQVLPGWAAWSPETGTLITAQLTDLDDRVLWRLAVPPLISLLAAGQPGPVLRDLTSQLTGLDRATAGTSQPGRDRPARQRLSYITQQITSWARRGDLDPDLDRGPLADAGRRLARIAGFTGQGAALLIAATHLQRGMGQQLTKELTEICDLLQDQPATAARTAQALAFQVADQKNTDLDTLHQAATALENDPRLCAGLFTVALARHGVKLGWPATWQDQIRRLRNHPLPDVSTAALDIVMAPE
jgi:hypothetical protein